MELKIDKEFRDLIPPLQEDELKQLESNIVNEGWRSNERILTWNGFIVDGHNRYSICQKNNIKFQSQEKQFKDKNEVMLWIIENQLGRRNLQPFDRGRLILRYKVLISANSPKGTDTREELAKMSNLGSNTISRIEFIEEKATPEIKEKLSAGTETINQVYTNLKRQEQVTKAKEDYKQNKTFKSNVAYSIIYADPPWTYNKTVGEGIAEEQYTTLSLDKIKSYLNDNQIKTQNDSILFLWVTFPLLKEGLEVMDTWGFKYKTCGFNWIKLNKNQTTFFGIGHYTKSNSELCLIGIKGKGLMILDNTISQIIMTEKEKHSKKPNCVREKIVKLVGDLPRIELFAREKTEGWDVWGNEV